MTKAVVVRVSPMAGDGDVKKKVGWRPNLFVWILRATHPAVRLSLAAGSFLFRGRPKLPPPQLPTRCVFIPSACDFFLSASDIQRGIYLID